MLLLDLLLFTAGAAITIKGADYFTDGAIYLARTSGVSEVVIGATIVSIATTLPEFSVSSYAAYCGHSGLATGNAVGSVLCNTGIILGGSVLVRSCCPDEHIFRHEGVFMVLCGALVLIMASNRTISRLEGAILLGLCGTYLAFSAVAAMKESKARAFRASKRRADLVRLGFFVVGGLMVGIGSRILVATGVRLATSLGISEVLVGLTMMALGTSLPEMVTAIVSLCKGHQALSVGNILGANILNLTWVVGGAATIRAIPVGATTVGVDLPVMLLILLLLVYFGRTRDRLDRWEGAVLLAVYVGYLAYRVTHVL